MDLITLEQTAYYKISLWRDHVLQPAARLLNSLGVTPNSLGVFRIITGLAFIFLVPGYPLFAFILLALGVGSDAIDGVLARLTSQSSSSGRLMDTIADRLTFVLYLIGLISASLISIQLGLIYIILIILAAGISSLRNLSYHHHTGRPTYTTIITSFPSSACIHSSYLLFLALLVFKVNFLPLILPYLLIIIILEIIANSLLALVYQSKFRRGTKSIKSSLPSP